MAAGAFVPPLPQPAGRRAIEAAATGFRRILPAVAMVLLGALLAAGRA